MKLYCTILSAFQPMRSFAKFVNCSQIPARRVASTPYVVLTGYPPPARVPPRPGYPPCQGTPLARVPPSAGPGRVPPRPGPPWLDRPGYPPTGWTWQGTPPLAPWHSGKCCKALWDTGTPPSVDRLKTLPSPSFGCGR